jgi:RimJ/RimL family protein N-acetyltransferase
MNILGEKIILRAIEEEDLVLLHKWGNDTNTQDIMGDINFPSSMDFHKRWFENLKNDNSNLRLAIEVNGVGLIGLSNLMKIDWRNKNAWYGILIGEKDNRGLGYGRDILRTSMLYAFNELNLNRLDTSIIEYNKVSLSLFCNVFGWKKVGIRKNYYYRKGKYWNQILVGITRKEYLNNDDFSH